MSEKFKIDRNKLKDIFERYNQEIQGLDEDKKESIKNKYTKFVINELGTEVLKEAISEESLNYVAGGFLDRKLLHEYYTYEESLNMLEGISNYEIIGDWQHFLTINAQYLFKLPKNMQEKFAENFSIGNKDAKECLLKLWKYHIETTGTDIVRPESKGSTNNITISCFAPDMRFMLETLRKNIAG